MVVGVVAPEPPGCVMGTAGDVAKIAEERSDLSSVRGGDGSRSSSFRGGGLRFGRGGADNPPPSNSNMSSSSYPSDDSSPSSPNEKLAVLCKPPLPVGLGVVTGTGDFGAFVELVVEGAGADCKDGLLENDLGFPMEMKSSSDESSSLCSAELSLTLFRLRRGLRMGGPVDELGGSGAAGRAELPVARLSVADSSVSAFTNVQRVPSSNGARDNARRASDEDILRGGGSGIPCSSISLPSPRMASDSRRSSGGTGDDARSRKLSVVCGEAVGSTSIP